MADTGDVPEKQPRKPLQSWTKGSQKEWERRENGMISPRQLYGRGEWALRECEEHTTWANGHLKKRRYRLISDLRKSIGDGLTLVHLLDVLTEEKIPGIQNRPILRAQKLENLQKCLHFLESKGVRLYGITADHLADGNLRTTLTLLSAVKDKFEPKVQLNGNDSYQDNQETTEDGYQRALRESSGYNIAYLPGTMAAPQPETEQSPPTDKIMSTTQLDKRKVEQHGADQRRQQLIRGNSGTVGPQPDRSPPTAWSNTAASHPPMRENVSLTVEERLKSLLDSPDLGGLAQPTSQDYDDGELITPPPPPTRRIPMRYSDEDDDRRLQAALDGTVPYNAYQYGDWEHYGSYVPSHSGEKKEGPRVQSLLERPAPATPGSQRPSNANVQMSPKAVHYNHSKSPSTSTSSSSVEPQSRHPQQQQSQQRTAYWNSSDNLREACNIMYNPAGNQTVTYQQGSKQLPTYSEHVHRHQAPPPQHWRDQSPSRHRDFSPGRHQRDSSPVRQPRDFSPTRQPRDSSPVRQPHTRDFSPARQQRDSSPVRQPHQSPSRQRHDFMSGPSRQLQMRTQSHENNLSVSRGPDINNPPQKNFSNPVENPNIPSHMHGQQARGQLHDHHYHRDHERLQHNQRPITGNNSLPMNRLASQESTVSYNSITDSMTSTHGQMSFLAKLPSSIKTPRSHVPGHAPPPPPTMDNRGGEGRIDLELNYTPSESSSRSHTPPLPALSPDNTPPVTPPESPLPTRHAKLHNIGGTNPSPFEQLAKMKASKANEKKKKGNSRSSSSQMRLYPHSIFHRGSGRNKQRKRFDRNNLSPPIHEYAKSEDSYDDDTARDSETISLHIDTQDSYGLASESQTEDSTRPMHYDADSVRHQLVALEKMYQDILHVIGSNKDEKIPNTRFMGSQQSLQSRGKVRGGSRRGGQRDKDIRIVNKRFARVESHVVTLARSVAHLSSELRSQNSLLQEIEFLKHEIHHLKELHVSRDFAIRSGQQITPSAANSHKIKKLTKFFGEEPPLLAIFLKQLGYEKYVPFFEKEKVGMVELPFLSEQRLERLGIPTGPRLRIMHEAQLMMS